MKPSASNRAESSWGADNSAQKDAAQNDQGEAQQSAGRSANQDQSQSSSQKVGVDAALDADRVQQQKAEDAELAKRWPEVSEAAEAALKAQYHAVREQAERARQAAESAVRDLDQRFAQGSQDLSNRQAQDVAAQRERDPAGVQQLQALQEQDRQNLQAEFQRMSADLGEAREAIERELNGARRDLAEARANGPHQDQGLDRDAVERLSRREDNLARIEQERTQDADNEAQQSAGRSANQDQSQSSSQKVGVDAALDADRVQQQKAEDAELAKRWPEVSEAAEAALKAQYQSVREQAERARQAVESAVRDLDQRFAQGSQDLSNRQAQDMAAQRERGPGDVQQLQALQEQDRQNLQAEFQRKSADLGGAREAIERELNGARRDLAEARANGPHQDQGLDRDAVERLSRREDNLARIEQERTQDADNELQQSAGRSANQDQSQSDQRRKLNDQDKTLDAARADLNRRLDEADENNRKQIATFEALRQEIGKRRADEIGDSRNLEKVSNLIEQQQLDLAERDLVKLAEGLRPPQQDETRDKKVLDQVQLSQQSGTQAKLSQEALGNAQTNNQAFAQLESKPRELALQGKQLVRESNLTYDFDHWQPQSEYRELSNKASNIGFLSSDENRRKGAIEFRNLPELKDAVSLKEAMEAGEDAVRKLVSDMLGSLRFSEIAELNELWQRASNKETRSYSESQAAFRKLIGSNNAQEPANIREAAETLRQSLKAANVEVIPNGNSFKLRLDDSTFRR